MVVKETCNNRNQTRSEKYLMKSVSLVLSKSRLDEMLNKGILNCEMKSVFREKDGSIENNWETTMSFLKNMI